MWFAVAILGVIGMAIGVTLFPHAAPTSPPPASSAPATPGGQDTSQH